MIKTISQHWVKVILVKSSPVSNHICTSGTYLLEFWFGIPFKAITLFLSPSVDLPPIWHAVPVVSPVLLPCTSALTALDDGRLSVWEWHQGPLKWILYLLNSLYFNTDHSIKCPNYMKIHLAIFNCYSNIYTHRGLIYSYACRRPMVEMYIECYGSREEGHAHKQHIAKSRRGDKTLQQKTRT